jgi:hypothetical protein
MPHTSCAVLIFAMLMFTARTQIPFWAVRHSEEKGDKKPSKGNQKNAKPLQPKLKNTIEQINTPVSPDFAT